MFGKLREGVQSGKITPQELSQLMQGVQQLAQATKNASADGQITRGEAEQQREFHQWIRVAVTAGDQAGRSGR